MDKGKRLFNQVTLFLAVTGIFLMGFLTVYDPVRVFSDMVKEAGSQNVSASALEPGELLISGEMVGVYLETQGVLVVDTGEIVTVDGSKKNPARNLVKSGDYIVAMNDHEISKKQELIKELENLDADEVILTVRRNREVIPVSVKPVLDAGGIYRLGIWVRDDTQGVGTLTYIDGNGNYGALGHGISDVDTGELLDIKEGELYRAEVIGIQKGSRGSPGEIAGMIRYTPSNVIGSVNRNTDNGIYGVYEIGRLPKNVRKVAVVGREEIQEGPAGIYCSIDGTAKEYEAEIIQIVPNSGDTNKSFVIQVTDEKLLEQTGGILRGMSGSPILQNGKLVGAVTHVFVNDPTRGYGIFIENMLDAAA